MLRNAILATLAYYDAFDHPLTIFELHRYLVNPTRLSQTTAALGDISLPDILSELQNLQTTGKISSKNGFYMLPGREEWYKKRIQREKIAAQKWKQFRRYAFWLQATPFISGLFASGSMALGTTELKSDFDVLVIVKAGRLYTARLFLLAAASLLGVRRTRYEKVAPNKLCFNHYITDESLLINHESLYNAHSYAHLIPLHISESLFYKFYKENYWISKYVYNFRPHYERILRMIKSNILLVQIARSFERVLQGLLGEKLEGGLRFYQQKRINMNPATHAPGGRIVFTDKELEFHPYSFEKTVIDHYNKQIKALGISFIEEPDSGLQ
ncbi:hypothetical protein KW791_03625 [Candidatus Parcubacteria bacterium]|nr:hypothetical protein [Candidatus Parcubacteria bacterium]